MTREPTTVERYEAKVDRSGGPDVCHPWIASLDSSGYGAFRVDGRTLLAHRWAYEYRVGPIPNGMVVRHVCDLPSCQNLTHMLLGTQQDNMNDRNSRGRQAKGEANGRAKLTEADVRWIRELRAAGMSQREIGEKVGMSTSHVSHILCGKKWAHV